MNIIKLTCLIKKKKKHTKTNKAQGKNKIPRYNIKTRGEEHAKSRFPFHASQPVLNIILLKFSFYLIFLSLW